jgi:hypothetical protein
VRPAELRSADLPTADEMPSRAHTALPNVSISMRTRLGVHGRVPRKARCNPPSRSLRFLLADDQVNDAGWIGNEKAVKIFPQLLDFIAAGDAVHF